MESCVVCLHNSGPYIIADNWHDRRARGQRHVIHGCITQKGSSNIENTLRFVPMPHCLAHDLLAQTYTLVFLTVRLRQLHPSHKKHQFAYSSIVLYVIVRAMYYAHGCTPCYG